MESNKPDLSSYTLVDLLDDTQFVQWVYTRAPFLERYWEQAQQQNPHLVDIISEARQLISSVRFQTTLMEDQQKDDLWNAIQEHTTKSQRTGKLFTLWLRSAAAVLLVGFILLTLHLLHSRTVRANTAFGQVKTFVLPDGSTVILNANSAMSYVNNWDNDKPREVWLKGEAFFKVKHLNHGGTIQSGQRFLVHAGKVDIEVLGTTFNVSDRRSTVNVSLVTGKVSMRTTENKRHSAILLPGDVFEYDARTDTIIPKLAKTGDNVAWKDGMLVYEQTPFRQVCVQLEDLYGYKIIIKNPGLINKKLSGRFESSNIDQILKALSMTVGFSIEKDAARHQYLIK